MQQVNPAPDKVKEIQIVAGLKVVETEYKVKVPVFVDEEIKRPIFVMEEIKVPTGIDELVKTLTERIASELSDKVTAMVEAKLNRAIDNRLKEVKTPKYVEELIVTQREVQVDKPIFTDVAVDRPVFRDVEIINPIRKDVEVVNAVIIDRAVTNAVIDDIRVTNAIIKDVDVERAVIRERVIEVVHKNCLDAKGNPLV